MAKKTMSQRKRAKTDTPSLQSRTVRAMSEVDEHGYELAGVACVG